MKKMLEVDIDGFEGTFQFLPIPLSRGLKLNRDVEKLTIQALKALDSLKEPLIDLIIGNDEEEVSDDELVTALRGANLEKIMEVLARVSDMMSHSEFMSFVKELTADVKFLSSEYGAVDVSEDMDKVFAGNMAGIYVVLFNVMKYNNFTPFAVAGIGNLMGKIGSSPMLAEKPKPSSDT